MAKTNPAATVLGAAQRGQTFSASCSLQDEVWNWHFCDIAQQVKDDRFRLGNGHWQGGYQCPFMSSRPTRACPTI